MFYTLSKLEENYLIASNYNLELHFYREKIYVHLQISAAI